MKYIYKHGNKYWYQKSVPKELVPLLKIKTIKVCLKTNKLFVATERAQLQASEHKKMFNFILSKSNSYLIRFLKGNIFDRKKYELKFTDDFEEFTKKILKSKTELFNLLENLKKNKKIDSSIENFLFNNSISSSSLMSNILTDYFKIKGLKLSQKKSKNILKSVSYLTQICGDKNLDYYTKNDALKFRDKFIDSKKIPTGKRNQSNIQNIFTVMFKEMNVERSNPFSMLEWPNNNIKNSKKPYTETELKLLQTKCVELCDDLRLIIAMMIDTGCKASEIVGMHVEDVNLNSHLPFIIIRSNTSRKILRSIDKRTIPLVGISLWAAKTKLKKKNSSFLFPNYCSNNKNTIPSAENSINKWLKENIPEKTIYSFRLAIINRLKKIDCPEEIILDIVGKSKFGGSKIYSRQNTLEMKIGWMSQIVLK